MECSGAAAAAARIMGIVLFLAVIGWIVARPARSKRVLCMDVVLSTAAGMLILPFAWFHYYCIVVPVLLAVFTDRGALRSPRLTLGLVVAGTVIGALLDIDLVGRKGWEFAAHFGNAVVGAMLVAGGGLTLREDWRRTDGTAEDG
jgi:hypothetical protein